MPYLGEVFCCFLSRIMQTYKYPAVMPEKPNASFLVKRNTAPIHSQEGDIVRHYVLSTASTLSFKERQHDLAILWENLHFLSGIIADDIYLSFIENKMAKYCTEPRYTVWNLSANEGYSQNCHLYHTSSSLLHLVALTRRGMERYSTAGMESVLLRYPWHGEGWWRSSLWANC